MLPCSRERRESGQADLFKARLNQIVDTQHSLANSRGRSIGALEKSFGAVYSNWAGQPPLQTSRQEASSRCGSLVRGWSSSLPPAAALCRCETIQVSEASSSAALSATSAPRSGVMRCSKRPSPRSSCWRGRTERNCAGLRKAQALAAHARRTQLLLSKLASRLRSLHSTGVRLAAENRRMIERYRVRNGPCR
jgi:hypothetical protein